MSLQLHQIKDNSYIILKSYVFQNFSGTLIFFEIEIRVSNCFLILANVLAS